MPIQLAKLPYEKNSLEPYITAETMNFHYDKHHSGYVDKLNKLIDGTPFEDHSLEQIIERARGRAAHDILNNALQAWNHAFLWSSMSPDGGGEPGGSVADKIDKDFGSFDAFRNEFLAAATSLFGSGWVWLCDHAGTLKILSTGNADSPIGSELTPLLVLDVWEHAYYIDYRNDRKRYVEQFLDHLINWEFAAANVEGGRDSKAA